MKIETITLKPGSIILWKKNNFWSKLMNKVLRRTPSFNECAICQSKMDWIINVIKPLSHEDIKVLEPKKPYSKIEQEMLSQALDNRGSVLQEIEKLAVINIVRPETIDMSNITLDSLLQNKYYKIAW